jgi:putative acetyltransferase
MDFIIRPVEIKDARGINELRRMPGVFENILGIPSERLKKSEDHIINIDNNTHQLVAVTKTEDNEEIVIGVVGLTISASPRMRHSGSMGIMVHKDYQNNGIGTALMRAIMDIADNWLMLVRVELSVFEDNERAIHLYEKFGFKKEGLKRYATIRNGKYENEYIMARILGE